MIRLLLSLTAILTMVANTALAQGLIVNEASNGPGGTTAEYMELLVIGPPCSSVDLRFWIIDDNNGDFGGGSGQGIANGHLRFTDSPVWQDVPVGSLIVIYNQSDANTALPADDPADSNGDNVYVLPASHGTLEGCNDLPTSNDPNYNCTGFSAGLPTAWSLMALRNGGDAVQTRRPDQSYFHGLAWGDLTGGPDNILFPGSGTATNYFFSGGSFSNADNYLSGDAGTGDETPGLPNNALNQQYIDSLQASSDVAVNLGADGSLCPGETITLQPSQNFDSYLWSTGATTPTITISDSGTYFLEATTTSGCIGRDTIVYTLATNLSVSLGDDVLNCTGNPYTINAPAGFDSYLWFNGTTTQSVTVTESGSYTVEVTAGACTGADTIEVAISTVPDVGPNLTLCDGQAAAVAVAEGYASVLWSTGETTNEIEVSTAGPINVQVTDSLGCIHNDGLTVTISNTGPTASFDVMQTATCVGVELGIENTSTGANTFQWFLNGSFLTNAAIPELELTAGETVDLTLEASIDNSCADAVTQAVTGVGELAFSPTDIPNIITPNGDNVNDAFVLTDNPDLASCIEVQIFNRWGCLIHEGAGDEPWEGINRGEKVLAGTFFTVVTVNGTTYRNTLTVLTQ